MHTCRRPSQMTRSPGNLPTGQRCTEENGALRKNGGDFKVTRVVHSVAKADGENKGGFF